MKIKIEPRDKTALIVALRVTVQFWFRSRNQCQNVEIREYHRKEARAAIRLLRAAEAAE